MPEPSGVVVGVDAGGTNVKATAFDLDTGTSCTASRAVDIERPHPGYAERDADVLWHATAAVIREALDGLEAGAERVRVVGVTGHGNGAYLVDAEGRPTRAAIQASDTRAGSLVRRWIAEGVDEQLRPFVWNGMWPGQPGPILAWLIAHEPDVVAKSSALLMCSDFLRGRLTGELTAEITSWSCNGLVDPSKREFCDEALDAYGIAGQRKLLAPLVRPEEIVGTITEEASTETSIPAGVPVTAGAVDNVALHLGSGVLDGCRVVVGAGTWSINQLLVPAERMRMDGELGSVHPSSACIAIPETMAMLIEASATSASAFGWLLTNVLKDFGNHSDDPRADRYAAALTAIDERGPDPEGPIFVPHLDGSRDFSTARGAWVGLSSSHDDVDMARAVVEGICFEHRRHVDRLSRALRGPVPLRLAGGASRSPIWAQMFADVTGRAIEVCGQEELGAVGAAVIAGTSIGVFESLDDGLSRLNPDHSAYFPSTERERMYDDRYHRYLHFATLLEADPLVA